MKKIITVGIILISITLTACWYNHKWEDLHPKVQNSSTGTCDTGGTVSYISRIKPIINAGCNLNSGSGCHGGGGGGLDYRTFSNVQHDALNGQLFLRLRAPISSPIHMPLGGGFLPDCDTLKLRLWIIQGAQNN